ncbi:hypothetical protein [Neobacillus sp. FSL H8-0543]|uniref:hypothetical protein n=1 Tax=Neobacillus sp. FSL H8-0543 TaxID=2954672 RepID=UPI003158B07E
MFFFWLFLIGMVIPFLLIKIKSGWAAWVPAIIFGSITIILAVVIKFIPAEGMMDLGQIIYFMMFGSATLGSLVGGVIVHFIKKK